MPRTDLALPCRLPGRHLPQLQMVLAPGRPCGSAHRREGAQVSAISPCFPTVCTPFKYEKSTGETALFTVRFGRVATAARVQRARCSSRKMLQHIERWANDRYHVNHVVSYSVDVLGLFKYVRASGERRQPRES